MQLSVLIARRSNVAVVWDPPRDPPLSPLSIPPYSTLNHLFTRTTGTQMDPSRTGTTIKKQEDDDKAEKRPDIKPAVKTLNRVPRKPWLSCSYLEILT
jgi:hypothetical protein